MNLESRVAKTRALMAQLVMSLGATGRLFNANLQWNFRTTKKISVYCMGIFRNGTMISPVSDVNHGRDH